MTLFWHIHFFIINNIILVYYIVLDLNFIDDTIHINTNQKKKTHINTN